MIVYPFVPFSFDNCIVCPSSIHGFWLPYCWSFCPFSFGNSSVCPSLHSFWLLLWYLHFFVLSINGIV